MQEQTLFEKYGGFSSVSHIVHDFYDRVMESERLNPFFAKVNVDRLMHHQINFLCKVLGGPDNYEGRSLEQAHARANIPGWAFDEVATLLTESLEEAGVEPCDVVSIIGIVASVRSQIVANQTATVAS